MFRASLRTKLIISSLLILMPILVLLILNYRAAYDNQKNQVLADQVRVAQVVGVTVDGVFDQALAIDRSYANDPIILSFDRARIEQHLAGLGQTYPEYEDAVAVFDANGDYRGSTIDVGPLNVADREWFQELIRTRQPVVSDVIVSRGTGNPIIVTAVPITDSNGAPIGAVVSTINLDHFPDLLKTVHRAPEQNIFLSDKTGRLAFHTGEPNLTWEQRDVSSYAPISAALGGGVFESERTASLVGDVRMVVATETPKYGWVVGVSIPVDVALAPIQDSQWNSIITFVGVFIFTIGLALGMSELLLRPLRQITEGAIALGRGQLQRRVRINTGDELGNLGNSFNAMADEMQRALHLREEFLSVASHELRTPLTVIKGYSQWLLTKETAEEKRRVLQTIVRQVDRIAELLDEMLTVSELQAGRLELHNEKMDLTALTKEVVDRMQMITEKHRLLFKDHRAEMVDADRNQIDVVLTNLIDNAIRYNPNGGHVEVAVSRRAGKAIVCVKDLGMGIPEEKQKHVFEPFFQIQPAIAGFGGMGLGLYITKQIVERHGGKIWFESKEDQGSTFCFSLSLIDGRHSSEKNAPRGGEIEQ